MYKSMYKTWRKVQQKISRYRYFSYNYCMANTSTKQIPVQVALESLLKSYVYCVNLEDLVVFAYISLRTRSIYVYRLTTSHPGIAILICS